LKCRVDRFAIQHHRPECPLGDRIRSRLDEQRMTFPHLDFLDETVSADNAIQRNTAFDLGLPRQFRIDRSNDFYRA
jgi:hypothetical protein